MVDLDAPQSNNGHFNIESQTGLVLRLHRPVAEVRVTQSSIRWLCPKLPTGPEWKFPTENRNLLVKHFNKFNHILTIHFRCRCSQSTRTFTSQDWRNQTVFASPLPKSFALQPWVPQLVLHCLVLYIAVFILGSLSKRVTFYNTKLCCGDNLLFQQVQIEELDKTAPYCSDPAKMHTRGDRPRSDSSPMLYFHWVGFKSCKTSFFKGKNTRKSHTNTGSSGLS